MKKWLCIGLSLLFLLTTGCALMPLDEEGSTPTTTTTTTTATTTTTTEATTTYLTEEEAIAIAVRHFGIQPGTVDQQTGYVMSYRSLYPLEEDTPYYVIALQWLVTLDGQPSHQSILSKVIVDAVTGAVSPADDES